MSTTRREVLQLGAVGAAGALGAAGLSGSVASALAQKGEPSNLAPRNRPVPFRGVFMRPPVLTPFATGVDDEGPFEKYAVAARLGQVQILPGLTTTVGGYNGIFPGPTIRARVGTRTELRIRNAFPTTGGLLFPEPIDISTHNHGMSSLPQYDGYANDITVPGFVKNYHYPNNREAATLWYHDHRHLVTDKTVYGGLAAFYLLSDQFERAQLPQGEFDVPLMITDALFNPNGSLAFDDNGQKGLWGDVIMVNGVPWPTMRVKPRIYRFRWLTATIARSFRPTLSNGDPLHIVACDGGMTPIVQPMASFRTGNAERTEFLIDFRGFRAGQTIDLRNLSPKNNIDFANTDKIMRFQVVEDSGPASTITSIPTRLDPGPSLQAARGGIPAMDLTPQMARVKRELRFERSGGEWVVNKTTWLDVEESGFTLLEANPQPFAVEQWDLTNHSGGWFHPVHIHLIDGKTIARNTNGGRPLAWEGGPKDVWYVGEGETVTVLIQFKTQVNGEGRYMIHCHNLVHEDHDMMVQLSVGDLRDNDPITASPPFRDPLPANAFPPVYLPGFPPGT